MARERDMKQTRKKHGAAFKAKVALTGRWPSWRAHLGFIRTRSTTGRSSCWTARRVFSRAGAQLWRVRPARRRLMFQLKVENDLYEGLAVKQVKFLCSAEGRFSSRPAELVRRAQKRSGLAEGHRHEAAWS